MGCEVLAVITKSSVLPRSWVTPVTCCVNFVLKSPHTTISVGWVPAISNTVDMSSRNVPKHEFGGRYITITRVVQLVRAFRRVTESVSEARVSTLTRDTSWRVLRNRTLMPPPRRAPPRGWWMSVKLSRQSSETEVVSSSVNHVSVRATMSSEHSST